MEGESWCVFGERGEGCLRWEKRSYLRGGLFSVEFKVCPFFCHLLQQLTLLLDKVSPKILRHYFHFRPEIK